MKNTNITLIGMPSAGKTYLGKRLAGKFGKTWVDLDTASYHSIIQVGGTEKEFMKAEEKVLLSATGKNCLFTCGGSSIYSKQGMEHLENISLILYLKLPLEVIKKRLGDFSNRGVIKADKLTLSELYAERCPLYEKYCDLTFSFNKDSAEEQFLQLCRFVQDVLC